ncbi:MAG: hypothetical protein ABIG68_09780 [Acidobacteriota bacterium]
MTKHANKAETQSTDLYTPAVGDVFMPWTWFEGRRRNHAFGPFRCIGISKARVVEARDWSFDPKRGWYFECVSARKK